MEPVSNWALSLTLLQNSDVTRVTTVVAGNYKDLLVVIATSAATLIGLLFVAMSVAKGRAEAHPQVIREFRSAAALLAFTNPFTVALFGLVPGTNLGYPAAIVGVVGLAFACAGIRTTISTPSQARHRRAQVSLIGALLVVFGIQIGYGIDLIINPRRVGLAATIADVLIASLLIGIGRAWELVGQWDTGLMSSIGILLGRNQNAQPTADQDDSGPTRTGGNSGPG